MSDKNEHQKTAQEKEAELRASSKSFEHASKGLAKPQIVEQPAVPGVDEPAPAPVEPEPYVDLGAAILADEHIADEAPPKPLVSTDISDKNFQAAHMDAMLRVAQSMERIVERNEAIRQIPYSEVKPVSSFNPEGRKDHPTFTRPTMMDGISLNSLMHSREEITLFNQIKPGRYWDRKIEVRKGSSGEIDLVRIGGRIDQRMERNAKFPTLVSLLHYIIEERKQKEARRRAGVYEDAEEVL